MRADRAGVARRAERRQGIGRLRAARRASSSPGRCSSAPTWSSSRSGPASPRGSASARPTRPRARSTARSPASGSAASTSSAPATTSTTSGSAGLLERHGAGASAGAGGRPRRRRARRRDRGARGAARTRAHRRGRAHRRLDDAWLRSGSRRARPCSRAGFACYSIYACADGRHADGRRARAEVLRAALRARRAARARGAAVRRRPGRRSRRELAGVFATRPLEDWLRLFEGEDVCVGPVATRAEAAADVRRPRARPRARDRRSTRRRGAGSSGCDRASRRGGVRPEPRDARLLVDERGVDRHVGSPTATPLIADAQDAAYSPDGTLVAFARRGDLWLANADGSGQRRLVATPHVVEWGRSGCRRRCDRLHRERRRPAQIRVVQLPKGPSQRHRGERTRRSTARPCPRRPLAFVSTRDGTPAIYVAERERDGATPFDTTPPATAVRRSARPRVVARRNDARLRRRRSQDGDDARSSSTTARRRRSLPGCRIRCASPQGTRIAFAGGDRPRVGRDRRHRCARSSAGQAARLARRAGRHAAVPESRAAAAERARDRAHRARTGALGFTSMVDNRGPGILWIRGHAAGGLATIMNVGRWCSSRRAACASTRCRASLKYMNAPPHHHWHFLGFDRYELRSASDFKLVVRDYKSGFCIADHYGTAIGVPHGPPRFLGNCAQFDPKATAVEEGSSVGYTDRYPAFFHGQQLDITKVPRGPLLARPPRERGLPSARDELQRRRRLAPDPAHVARRRAERDDAPHLLARALLDARLLEARSGSRASTRC